MDLEVDPEVSKAADDLFDQVFDEDDLRMPVVGTEQVAEALDVPETAVRATCKEQDVPRIGTAYILSRQTAIEVAQQLYDDGYWALEDDEDPDDEDDDDDDDEADED
jgi:hypothetical protein